MKTEDLEDLSEYLAERLAIAHGRTLAILMVIADSELDIDVEAIKADVGTRAMDYGKYLELLEFAQRYDLKEVLASAAYDPSRPTPPNELLLSERKEE